MMILARQLLRFKPALRTDVVFNLSTNKTKATKSTASQQTKFKPIQSATQILTKQPFPAPKNAIKSKIKSIRYKRISPQQLAQANFLFRVKPAEMKPKVAVKSVEPGSPFDPMNPVQPSKKKLPKMKMPTLQVKSEEALMKNWWSERPFETNSESFVLPVFSFTTGRYLRENIEVPADIFNCPLRRDLLKRLYEFRIKLNVFTTKVTRTRGMTVGSRIKIRPQKGSGRARLGDKRAPHLRKGGKAHGAKAVVYSHPLNSKIKLKALKTLLTAKLVEGKIRVIDSEHISDPKTNVLWKLLGVHAEDDRALFCILTQEDRDSNFERARRNIKQIMWHDSYGLDVLSLFRADKILITKEGMRELIENIKKTEYLLYRQPHMPKLEEQTVEAEPEVKWDPEHPYQFKFKILAQFMERYEKVKLEQPELLAKEFERVRRVPPEI